MIIRIQQEDFDNKSKELISKEINKILRTEVIKTFREEINSIIDRKLDQSQMERLIKRQLNMKFNNRIDFMYYDSGFRKIIENKVSVKVDKLFEEYYNKKVIKDIRAQAREEYANKVDELLKNEK